MCGLPGKSGKPTIAVVDASCGSGSGGQAAEDAGGGILGAALGVAAMQRGAFSDVDGALPVAPPAPPFQTDADADAVVGLGFASAVGLAAVTGVLVLAAGKGSGGVRLHPNVTPAPAAAHARPAIIPSAAKALIGGCL